MEYLDIYDSEGNPTGTISSKKEAHEKGFWHRSVHVWIITPDKQVLIQKRSPQKESNPGMWDISSAGHVSAGESDITSAVRETEEELGLVFPETFFTLIGVVKQMQVIGALINNEINPVYILKTEIKLEDIKRQKEEVSEVKLVPISEFKRMIENKDENFVDHPEEFELLFDYLEKNCK